VKLDKTLNLHHSHLKKAMSGKKRDEESIGPASSAGLLRFFQDESYGFKVSPELVIISAIVLIISVILAHVFYPNLI